ncbi:MAG TPA: DUF4142 domain-containing protein [Gemmatimonadaceae bacterium]|nr:DUF4142 domain-containing protein [Gemmatimonadaceae bacterium]
MQTGFGRTTFLALSSLALAAAAVAVPRVSNAQALTDANIVYILDQANTADSARGTLAESRGTSADVRSFGRLMAGEHHALRAQGQQLAHKLGVTPQAPAGDKSAAQAAEEMRKLRATPKGKGWDRAYIDYEVTYHQAVLETATKALGEAKNEELKNLIKAAAPVLQHHLEEAKRIQKQLGS